jgi:hypothetical protein
LLPHAELLIRLEWFEIRICHITPTCSSDC